MDVLQHHVFQCRYQHHVVTLYRLFSSVYSICPSSDEFNPHCCLLFTALRMMGYLYNYWGQYGNPEGYLHEALKIIQSAFVDRHVEAACGELTVILVMTVYHSNYCSLLSLSLSLCAHALSCHTWVNTVAIRGSSQRAKNITDVHWRSKQTCLVIITDTLLMVSVSWYDSERQ